MKLPSAAASFAILALAMTGCGEPANPAKDPAPVPAPAPIPSTPATPAPRVDNQAEPAPGQVHAAPTPADSGASSTHATPAPAETPGAGNAK